MYDSIFDDIQHVATLSELKEVCVTSRYDRKESLVVSKESLLLDYLEVISGLELERVVKLSNLIQRRCVATITKQDILDVSGLKGKRSVIDFFNKMEKVGVLRLEYPEGKNNKYSERRRLIFNPWLFWKGCYRKRREYRKEWNKKRGLPY